MVKHRANLADLSDPKYDAFFVGPVYAMVEGGTRVTFSALVGPMPTLFFRFCKLFVDEKNIEELDYWGVAKNGLDLWWQKGVCGGIKQIQEVPGFYDASEDL